MDAQATTKPKMVRTKSGSYLPESLAQGSPSPQGSESKSMVPKFALKTATEPPASVTYKTQTTNMQIVPPEATRLRSENEMPGVDDEDDIPLEKSNKRVYMISLFFTILVIAITSTLFYFRSEIPVEKISEPVIEVVSEEVTTEVAEIIPTAAPQLERSQIKLEVLNASGVSGAAGKLASTLEGLGYVEVGTGNAEEIEGNELYVKKEVENELAVLLTDLKKELGITKITDELTEGNYEARIVLGK